MSEWQVFVLAEEFGMMPRVTQVHGSSTRQKVHAGYAVVYSVVICT